MLQQKSRMPIAIGRIGIFTYITLHVLLAIKPTILLDNLRGYFHSSAEYKGITQSAHLQHQSLQVMYCMNHKEMLALCAIQ